MKRALVVGTNYPGTSFQLAGCVNDARDWTKALQHRGFTCTVLEDKQATRDAILAGLDSGIEASTSGDIFVFTFSGHGTWRPGGPDEPRDECICPNDVKAAGVIADDDLFELFSARKRGVRVVMVADSCHAGTINRLFGPLADGDRLVRFLPPSEWMSEASLSDQTVSPAASQGSLSVSSRKLATGALVLAGCGPLQVCYDASFGGRANGAFSYVALKALDELPATLATHRPSYRTWMRLIRKYLPSVDFDQIPQLDGSSYQKGWEVLEDTED